MKVQHLQMKMAGLGVFLAITLVLLVYLFKGAGGDVGFGKTYEVKAVVPEAFRLTPNADVRRAGVKIGKVDNITNIGSNGLLTLKITDKAQEPVYRDATVLVRTKTLVGENYVELDPGSPASGALPSGSTLSIDHAREAVPLDRILDMMNKAARERTTRDLRSLGVALDGRGEDLNRLYGAFRPAVQQGDRVVSILDGQRAQLRALVGDTASVLQAFANRTAQVRDLAGSLKTTATAVASRDAALASGIHELAPTLRSAQSTATQLGSFSRTAAPVVSDVRRGTVALAPVVRDLTPTAREATSLFAELPPALKQADPTVAALRSFADKAPPALDALSGFMRQVNPALAYLSPYGRDFGSFFANMGALFSKDKHGYIGHVGAWMRPESYDGWTPAMRKAVESLVYDGWIAKKGLVNPQHNNPYPKPGTIGQGEPFDGSYPRIGPAPR